MEKHATTPIAIAVVGHTNAGKTSLLRTLSRDKSFGQVSERHGETRQVEATSVSINGRAFLRLFDTPGFEDSIALHAYLQQFDALESRRAVLTAFLKSPEASGRFEQEGKILRLLLEDIDAVFYVIDTTESPHAKFRCELEVLAASSRPVMPVLNFVRHPDSRMNEWQAVLADRGLHVQVAFDAVAPLAGSERVLYEQLAALLGTQRARLGELMDALAHEAEARQHASRRAIADLLIDVAAYRTQVAPDDANQLATRVASLQTHVRQREQKCADTLLAIYRFDREDLELLELPTLSGRLDDDLFNPEVLKQTAQRLGKGAAVGAVVGLAADLAVAGISLGAGAIVGGAVGGMVVGGWQNALRWTREKINGYVDLSTEDITLSLLLARQTQLLNALQGRAHAATERLILGEPGQGETTIAALLKTLRVTRGHPEWSRLGDRFVDPPERGENLEAIAELLSVATQPSQLSPSGIKPAASPSRN